MKEATFFGGHPTKAQKQKVDKALPTEGGKNDP